MPLKTRIDATPQFESLQSASVRTGLSTDFLRNQVAEGRLPAFRVGRGRGLIRVRITDVDAMLRPIPTVGTLR